MRRVTRKVSSALLLCMFLLLVGSLFGDEEKCDMTISITDIRNSKGVVQAALYNSKDGFPSKNKKAVRKNTVEIENGKASVTFDDLPYGIYAIAIIHDENSNGKLDTNWMGIPQEGTGASNDAKGKMSPPSFKDASIELKQNSLNIEIKTFYY